MATCHLQLRLKAQLFFRARVSFHVSFRVSFIELGRKDAFSPVLDGSEPARVYLAEVEYVFLLAKTAILA